MVDTTTTTGSTSLPPFLQSRLDELLSKASGVYQQPYTAYTGPRIAGFNMDDATRFAQTRAQQGSYQPFVNQAANLYGTTGQLFNQGDMQQFMNPYVENVTDRIATLGNRNLMENILPNINNTFTGAGQFGSRRNYDFTNRAIRDAQEGISAAQGEALYNSQNAAMQNYQNALQRLGNTASGLGSLAGQQQQMQGVDLQRMAGIGQEQRDMTQQNYNLAYQDFLNQQGYPKQQLGWFSDIIRGVPSANTTTTTQSVPSPSSSSSLMQLLGLAGLSGLGGSGGISNLFGGMFAKGGEVMDKAKKSMPKTGGMRLGVA